jgi:hypothetical protein
MLLRGPCAQSLCPASCSGRTPTPARATLRCVAGKVQRKDAFSRARLSKKGGRRSMVMEAVKASQTEEAKLIDAEVGLGDASTIVAAAQAPEREVAVAIPYRVRHPHVPANSPGPRRTYAGKWRAHSHTPGPVRARGCFACQLGLPSPTCPHLQLPRLRPETLNQ